MNRQTSFLGFSEDNFNGEITLPRSKSISNRLLLIQALSDDPLVIENLSLSDDTLILKDTIHHHNDHHECGHGGTTLRFLLALKAIKGEPCTITGNDSLKDRPIKELVDALRILGADIMYGENEDHPPLRIGSCTYSGVRELSIDASISSQFISALMLISPVLPHGLILKLEGEVTSRPYIQMTSHLMCNHGASVTWNTDKISIEGGGYNMKSCSVEHDWSAAAFFYTIKAGVIDDDILLKGLNSKSIQGDVRAIEYYKLLGVETTVTDEGLVLTQNQNTEKLLEVDFSNTPDLAQPFMVACAIKGITCLYSGLGSLRWKETDRIEAMQQELSKVGVSLTALPSFMSKQSGKEFYIQEGKAAIEGEIFFDTYDDHRMAMALSAFAILGDISIHDSDVVSKSFPDYWEEIQKLGFVVTTKTADK